MYLHICFCGWSWIDHVPDPNEPCPICYPNGKERVTGIGAVVEAWLRCGCLI
jgi:hypothetical protein